MISSLYSLLFFTGWTILLVLFVAGFRTVQVLAGKKKSNEFPAWVQHGSDLYWRLHRAHINCIESLPVFAVLVLTSAYLGFQAPLFDSLAMIVCGGRVLQTSAHLSGGGEWNVNVRFTGFLIQYASFAYMLVILLRSML
ncbi:MAPEG family protein [Leptospira langatensis]|uniref:MAPEG family protein n=1 Tax=Leptospira langatensis TaxID=2484983 RepID=A0A5F1ZQU1_9LEPT|nr:MAPEG family protein [Leptospira langatensis]TGK02741.1 MAPEG family protein [Leptospira langatensis]TGL40055.1 MAPEG family protein [Leptospira langatensis]